MAEAYSVLYDIVLGILGLLLLGCLFRAIWGPRTADRLIAVNMCGTLTLIVICILAFTLKEGYLTDIAMIYAMLSFLAVVLLTKIVMGSVMERRSREEHHD